MRKDISKLKSIDMQINNLDRDLDLDKKTKTKSENKNDDASQNDD